jgi:hypothetical protein
MDRLVLSTLRESLQDANIAGGGSDMNMRSKNSNYNNNSNQNNKNNNNKNNNNDNNGDNGDNVYNFYPSSSSQQQNKIIDQISISTKIHQIHSQIVKEGDTLNYYELEDELRSTILNLSLLDVNMKRIKDGKKLYVFLRCFKMCLCVSVCECGMML